MSNAEKLRSIASDKRVQLGLTAVVSAAAGSGGTYLILSKRLEEKYATQSDDEIEKAREFYEAKALLNKEGAFSDPVTAFQELHGDEVPDKMEQYRSHSEDPENPETMVEIVRETEVVTVRQGGEETENIFLRSPITPAVFDYDAEVLLRTEEKPYIITQAEFLENGPGFDQVEATYYEGDGILADDNDKPIDDIDYVIGEDNILRFGQASEKADRLYVRNHVVSMDLEVTHSKGKYLEEVYGTTQGPGDHG